MQDIAQLGFSIDSSQARSATRDLDTLNTSAGKLSDQSKVLNRSLADSASAFEKFSQQGQTFGKQVDAVSSSLDALMKKLADTRQRILDSDEAFRRFTTTVNQVEALGRAFGQTAVGFEAFQRSADRLGLNATQTVSALTRITSAIEGQTEAGRQIRRVLEEYGVSLRNLGINEADRALEKFVERMRTFQDTVQKGRSVSMVLGPLDPDTRALLEQPGYTPITTRERREESAGFNRQAASSARNAAQIRRDLDRSREELSDLRGRYSINAGYISDVIGGGDFSLTMSESSQLDELRRIQRLPFREQLRYMSTSEARSAAYDRSIGSYFRYLNSGAVSANQAAISGERDYDYFRGDYLSGTWRFIGDTFRNLTNQYTPRYNYEDRRQEDPIERFLNSQEVASQVGLLGDDSLLRRQRAQGVLREVYGPDRNVRPEVVQNFRGAFGDTEGQQRLDNALSRIRSMAETATVPGQDQLDEAGLTRYISRLPSDRRGIARRLLTFSRQQGIDIAQYGRFPDNPDFQLDSLLNEDTGGMDRLSPRARANFQRIETDRSSEFRRGSAESVEQEIQLQTRLREAVAGGAAAVEDATTYWSTYLSLLEEHGQTDATVAATDAVTKAMERRRTEGEKLVDQIRRENDALERGNATSDRYGISPFNQALAAGESQVRERVRQEQERNPQLDAGQFEGELRRSSGLTAVQQVMAGRTQAANELDTQQRLLAVAGQRSEAQERLNRELQVENQFAEARAKAYISGSEETIRKIEEMISKIKEFRNEAAEAARTRIAIEFNTNVVAQNAATDQVMRMAPGAERNRAEEAREFGSQNPFVGTLRPAQQIDLLTSPNEEALRQRADRFGIEPERALDAWLAFQDKYSTADDARRQRFREGTGARLGAQAGRARARTGREAALAGAGGSDPNDPLARERDAAARSGVMLGFEEAGTRDINQSLDSAETSVLAAGRYRENLSRAEIARWRRARQLEIEFRGGLGADEDQAVQIFQAREAARAASLVESADQSAYESRLSVGDTRRLAAAASRGGAFERDERQTLELERTYGEEIKLLEQVNDKSQAQIELLERLREAYAGLTQAKKESNAADADLTIARTRRSFEDQNEEDQAMIDLGPFASSQRRGRALAEVRASRFLRDNVGEATPEQSAEVQRIFATREQLSQLRQDQERVREGFLQMTTSIQSAFETAIFQGGRARDIIGGLLQDMGRIGLRTVTQGLFQRAGDLVGGMFGSAFSSLFSAQGNVFEDLLPVRFASGGIIDRPTIFPMAQGGVGMAGEAGTEAIMPLRRLPNGDLGVKADGGNGQAVNSNVTINIDNSGGGDVDARAVNSMAERIRAAQEEAIMRTLVKQSRAGGMFYGAASGPF